jgi:hypothetical protein
MREETEARLRLYMQKRNLFDACQKPWVLAEKASGQNGKIREVFSFSTCYAARVRDSSASYVYEYKAVSSRKVKDLAKLTRCLIRAGKPGYIPGRHTQAGKITGKLSRPRNRKLGRQVTVVCSSSTLGKVWVMTRRATAVSRRARGAPRHI